MFRGPFLAVLLALVGSGVLPACSKKPPPRPAPEEPGATEVQAAEAPTTADAAQEAPSDPLSQGPFNVLLISVDSLRADMPWAGYPRAIAPRLTALHDRSTVYTRGYAISSFTSKSIGGLLSGQYPSALDRTGAFFTRYLASNTMMCETLEAEEIPCIAGHAHAYLGPKMAGFDQGFREWKIVPGITFDYNTDPYVTSQKLTPLAIEMLTEVAAGDRPFFAWFHYMDPHDEYQSHPESPKFGTKPRDRYDEEVFYTDLWIGKLLDFVESQPWAKRTVIVVTADHGEAFGEHGAQRHAREVWEELVHVPLFFYVPGGAPRRIDTPRGHVDLAPTFLELLGAKRDTSLPGESLVSELRGGTAAVRDVIIDLPEDQYNERRRALIHGKHKLIAFGNDARFSLFDLEADPKENDDLIRTNPELASQMKERYRAASKKIADVPPKGGIPKKKGQ
jgi:choline-sulfatase